MTIEVVLVAVVGSLEVSGLPTELALESRGAGTALGDPEFDAAFGFDGPSWVVGWLDAPVYPAVRARMLLELARGWPRLAEPLLREALTDLDPESRLIVATELADRPVLTSIVGDEEVPVGLRLQALTALDPRAEGEAETELLGLLATGGDQAVDAAARALARVGTVRAVPALQAAQRLFSPRVLREAVRAIQSRVEGERGGLAVAPESGALSEAPADGGRLSETE